MSVRIYQLSKEIGMENTELLDLLRERGFSVKSASSTIDNISADSLKEEFAKTSEATDSDTKTASAAKSEDEATAPKAPPAAPNLASFVRSKEDIKKEKDAASEAAKPAAPAPPAPPAAPAPATPKPAAPPPAGPPAAAPPKAAPPPAPSPKAPPPASPSAPRPAAPPPPPGSPGDPESASPASVAPPASPTAKPDDGEASDEIKQIVVKPPIVVRDFAAELGVKPFKLISELMEMGIFASINQSLQEDVASQLAEKHGFLLEVRHRGEGNKAKKKKEAKQVDETEMLEHRPPVVCIMGHVDHGKTSLLDYIRKESVTKGEAGGITQHIGAYQIEHKDHKITFLDTPGHSAFNAMRERGANVTDVAILVIAADDGFKPQTDEALKFIQKAGVQPIVAINKIDTKGANVDSVKQQMQERGIASEDWGGEVLTVPVSAIKGDGISELLDDVILQAEVLELQANPKKPAEGVIIEAAIEVGRGATATVIVSAGTLKVGDALVCGSCYTKVKAMFNEHGKPVKVAPPSTPVRIIGWSDTPDCGATFETVKNEKEAKSKAAENETDMKAELAAAADESGLSPQEKLFAAIAKTQKKTLRLILKGDAFGSVEAIAQALKEIQSDKVALEIIGKGVGIINKSDVQKASAGDAEIIGFNVKSDNGVAALAKNHSVKISSYQIIYELIDRVREDMVEMLDPEYRENKIGAAEVRAVFPIAKGFVAGCLVTEGRVQNGARARLLRKGKLVVESKVETLRRLKDEVKEVRAGTECGIQIAKHNDYREGDVIEIFETHEIRPEL